MTRPASMAGCQPARVVTCSLRRTSNPARNVTGLQAAEPRSGLPAVLPIAPSLFSRGWGGFILVGSRAVHCLYGVGGSTGARRLARQPNSVTRFAECVHVAWNLENRWVTIRADLQHLPDPVSARNGMLRQGLKTKGTHLGRCRSRGTT